MQGRIKAIVDGVTIRDRKFKNESEKYVHNEEYIRDFPNCKVEIVMDSKEATELQKAYSEYLAIHHWFGGITVGVADKLTLKAFKHEAIGSTYIEIRTLWQMLGCPTTFRVSTALKYLKS